MLGRLPPNAATLASFQQYLISAVEIVRTYVRGKRAGLDEFVMNSSVDALR